MFDVLVVGGGHAGCEAAAAAARRGASTALLTFDRANIGVMSCNPSIGGLGKGHIVREVDAFDGLMARAADAAAIHYRMLNRSKGAAVRGPRVQADRRLYAASVRAAIDATTSLTVIEGEAAALDLDGSRVVGVVAADGSVIAASAVVIATGTFLGGRIFRGAERINGGRVTERPSTRLGEQLRSLALPMGRLKTGTPPRLDGRTIDWAKLAEQLSDTQRWTMSAMPEAKRLPQIACAIARTNNDTHDLIRDDLHRSPLYSGAIESGGPRYCPSIEDKVARFGDRDGHQLFLEPEGLDDAIVYPNGLSTSLPADTQRAVVRSIEGLERAEIVMPGYAVEYDYIDPRALDPSLALSAMPGLYCAGQINGTTGYEEAAGQGLIAGLNAAAYARDLAPVILDRASSYMGVMIDDLTLQGITEPYRMLTARAEFRLSLRADNAETRLGTVAAAAGCLSSERLTHQRAHADARDRLSSEWAARIAAGYIAADNSGGSRTFVDWAVADPLVAAALTEAVAERFPEDVIAEVIEDARYTPYVRRQAQEVALLRAIEALPLPKTLSYAEITGLSTEMVDRLSAARPTSFAAASRVQGVTPAALSALLLYVRRAA